MEFGFEPVCEQVRAISTYNVFSGTLNPTHLLTYYFDMSVAVL